MRNNLDKLQPQIARLNCGAEVIWCVPLGGFAHAADEQPWPYIEYLGIELTPRYGGEECFTESGYYSLPLPRGVMPRWPMQQSLFNFFRRRVNIYWRNLFSSQDNLRPYFLFAQQLSFHRTDNGYTGSSPLLIFERSITAHDCGVVINDLIVFKMDVFFDHFIYGIHPELERSAAESGISLWKDIDVNHEFLISSSTGHWRMYGHRVDAVKFNKDDRISSCFKYEFPA